MAYTKLTQYDSPNYTPNSQVRAVFGFARTIESITIHWWGDPNTNPSFMGVVGWLSRAGGNSSAHTVATGTSNQVAWIVNAVDAAWHAGNAKGNASSIGIECDPRGRSSDYAVVAELIADIWISYNNKLPLVKHSSWSATACPGTYDLARLRREAEQWYAAKTAPAPAPKPKWVAMDKPRFMQAAVDLRVTDLNNNTGIGAVIKAGTPIDFRQRKDQNGTQYLRSAYSTDKNLNQGIDISKLKEMPAPAPTQPEWIKNLKDITPTKLTVLPAEGTIVYNLNTLQPVNDTIIPKGTQIDIVKETTVSGAKYYISSYAANGNVANGIPASTLGVPATPPVNEKPEWLKNLSDIEDQDFWTRSRTPVLNLEDGSTSRYLDINSQVRVTHTTRIVDIPLMVLEGSTEAIETIYLSDKAIVDPRDDLLERVNALEQIVNAIVDFLSSLFKNFKA